jgi:hypothetical protein
MVHQDYDLFVVSSNNERKKDKLSIYLMHCGLMWRNLGIFVIWIIFYVFFFLVMVNWWMVWFSFTSNNPKNKSLNKQREAKQHYQDTIRILIDWECVIVGFFYYYRVYCWSFNITHYNTLIYTFYLKLDVYVWFCGDENRFW